MKLLFLLIFSFSLYAENKCKTVELGNLDKSYIDEASGIVYSKMYGKIYHVNDSGGLPAIYSTDLKGENTVEIKIKDADFVDTEDMAYGNCEDQKCILVGDFGANARSRKENLRAIYFIKEAAWVSSTEVQVYKKLNFILPQDIDPNTKQEIDIESMAMHPNGDIYLVSKIYTYPAKKTFMSSMYKITKQQWQSSQNKVEAQKVATLDLAKIPKIGNFWGARVPTSMDISVKGDKFVILTYTNAIEFNFNLMSLDGKSVPELTDFNYSMISLIPQLQQEAITYVGEGEFIYTSEFVVNWFKAIFERVSQGKIYKVNCD